MSETYRGVQNPESLGSLERFIVDYFLANSNGEVVPSGQEVMKIQELLDKQGRILEAELAPIMSNSGPQAGVWVDSSKEERVATIIDAYLAGKSSSINEQV